MGQLYRLDFASGKSYIGITEQTARSRFNGHAESARKGSPCAVHRAWRKHGAPKLVVLAVLHSHQLKPTEQRAVRVFGTYGPNGYNMTPGGEVSPTTVPEIAARVGVKGNKNALGYKHTPETKALISKARLGKKLPPLSESARKKISAALLGNKHLLGKKFSLETREKMSRASKGRPKSAEHRINMSIGMLGVKHPNSTGEKHHLYGKKRPMEMGAKISSYRAWVQAVRLGVPFSPVSCWRGVQ